jgi:hypothetical protein
MSPSVQKSLGYTMKINNAILEKLLVSIAFLARKQSGRIRRSIHPSSLDFLAFCTYPKVS